MLRHAKTFQGLSILLGLASLAAVACFHFPSALTMPTLREAYPLSAVRTLLASVIVLAGLSGLVATFFGRRAGLLGVALAASAWVIGGTSVAVPDQVVGENAVGLDWLALDAVLLTGAVVLGERIWPRLRSRFRRPGWTVDAIYFVFNHLLAPVSGALFTWMATRAVFGDLTPTAQAFIASWPLVLQVIVLLVMTDLTQYWVHRVLHQVPWLWKFHAVHHSNRRIDALAASRNHVLESVVTRGLVLFPVFLFGFPFDAVLIFSVIVAVHATLLHANLRFDLRLIENIIVTPRYHHFHHSSERSAIDRNYAAFFPFIDRLFGSFRLPRTGWPKRYGCVSDSVPEGFLAQQIYPLRRAKTGSGEQAAA